MAKSKTTPEAAAGRSSSKSRKSSPFGTTMMDLMFPNSFSELEMKAIELLVQLSTTTTTTTSGGGSAASEVSNYYLTGNEEITSTDAKGGAAAVHDGHRDQVSLSLSSSSKSQKILLTEGVDRVDEDEDGVCLGLGQMRKKRFGSISELYELTEPLNNLNRKKKKRMSGHASSRSS
ncbi:hypothetical protein C1H46_035364 [Malus baccata]|uniref:Uncharacterized protein n=1 Tax=Malus baccata TaxID=106549 RepID=A0A540KXY0_MALBA|nr:hypothetical protein C1H46_035364 [Malus baccata]